MHKKNAFIHAYAWDSVRFGTTKSTELFFSAFMNTGDQIRTNDTSGMNRMLWPTELRRQMVAGEGFEPSTSGL